MLENTQAPHQFNVRVYYEDTDSLGMVFHSRYLHFFERARTEYCEQAYGVPVSAWAEKLGAVFVVRHMQLDFLKAALLGDTLRVESVVVRVQYASIHFEQRIYRGDTLLTVGLVQAVAIDAAGKPRRVPTL